MSDMCELYMVGTNNSIDKDPMVLTVVTVNGNIPVIFIHHLYLFAGIERKIDRLLEKLNRLAYCTTTGSYDTYLFSIEDMDTLFCPYPPQFAPWITLAGFMEIFSIEENRKQLRRQLIFTDAQYDSFIVEANKLLN